MPMNQDLHSLFCAAEGEQKILEVVHARHTSCEFAVGIGAIYIRKAERHE